MNLRAAVHDPMRVGARRCINLPVDEEAGLFQNFPLKAVNPETLGGSLLPPVDVDAN